MGERTVYIKGRRSEVRRALLDLPRVFAHGDLAEGFRNLIGFALLANIKDAFVTRSGPCGPRPGFGPSAAGYAWEKLAPSTIAQRRVGPRERKGFRKSSADARKERVKRRGFEKQLYRQYVTGFIAQGIGLENARYMARKRAHREVMFRYRDLAKTKVDLLGQRQVEILRDTGVLLNSLSPGQISEDGRTYTKPGGAGGDLQLMQQAAGEVVIGTALEYAAYHHSEEPRSRLPQRRLWPRFIPGEWWNDVAAVAGRAMPDIAIEVARRAGKAS
jgi:hypothetical protein